MFQSTFPQGERLCGSGIWIINRACFNPRSRKGNDQVGGTSARADEQFQSTFPQGERRAGLKKSEAVADVSIHVPARGTTAWRSGGSLNLVVSIHVPARGTTLVASQRPSELNVSIHVPARGTTLEDYIDACEFMFQSTFPQGERQRRNRKLGLRSCFNPRSRKGNDWAWRRSSADTSWFQSTFPQGERLRKTRCATALRMFQSTFPQGERRGEKMGCKNPFRFQSTFPQGERLLTAYIRTWRVCVFQSTFPQGERQQLPTIFICSPCLYLCNYTNTSCSMQVLPPIIAFFLNFS